MRSLLRYFLQRVKYIFEFTSNIVKGERRKKIRSLVIYSEPHQYQTKRWSFNKKLHLIKYSHYKLFTSSSKDQELC